MKPSLDAVSKDSRGVLTLNSSQVELRNLTPRSVEDFPVGLLWNCAVQLPPGERVWLSRYLHGLRNGRRPARWLMFRILSIPFLSQLPEWNCLACFGFDVEKQGSEGRISRTLRTLVPRTRKPE